VAGSAEADAIGDAMWIDGGLKTAATNALGGGSVQELWFRAF